MIVVIMQYRQRSKVAMFKPRAHQLLATIKKLAAKSDNVSFSEHCYERMEERGITTLDALRVLRNGEIEGEIEPGNGSGEWKCKIVERRRGSRDIGVATLVMKERRLFVKTVEWEDR